MRGVTLCITAAYTPNLTQDLQIVTAPTNVNSTIMYFTPSQLLHVSG